MSNNYIFALDIGTRSVVGVVVQETVKGLEIVASEKLEHPERAMIDGQIHDIERVADTIKLVKAKLENKIGSTLEQVAVAAAGRALKTVTVKVVAGIADNKPVEREDIVRLELQGVQEAQQRLTGSQDDEELLLNYHCVGYSVVNYELDGFKIGNLLGQKGNNIGAELIATFLPRVVVDSLIASLEAAGLEIFSLTLEPIAASTVVVPPGMRQLNLALVDVGAGTSDIAITDDGAIRGYGMVPVAGDEITEYISKQYLVDFQQAETLKRQINDNEEISFIDVLGIQHILPKQELLDAISETVKHLSKGISDKILELNGRPPQAVICIGGGSMTPMLREYLAEDLGIIKQRVAVRGREAITEVLGEQELIGSDSVTPIGIAVAAYENKGLGFAFLTVNGRQVRLFEVNKSTVADALVAAGKDIRKTRPRLGMAQTVTVNRELRIVRGGRGKLAVIKLNGREVSLDTPVNHNDVIDFVEAQDGEDAKGFIRDVIPEFLPYKVTINGETFSINPEITMNGQPVTYNDKLIDNANITCHLPVKLIEVLEISGFAELVENSSVFVNGTIAEPTTELKDGDEINIVSRKFICEGDPKVNDVEEKPQKAFTGSTIVYVNGKKVEIPREDVILTDILLKTDYPLTPPEPGLKLDIRVNGVTAEFTTPLKNGDNISLEWT